MTLAQYLHYSDSVEDSRFPHWVEEPEIRPPDAVVVSELAREQAQGLVYEFYGSGDEYLEAVQQVLRVGDIRSVWMRESERWREECNRFCLDNYVVLFNIDEAGVAIVREIQRPGEKDQLILADETVYEGDSNAMKVTE